MITFYMDPIGWSVVLRQRLCELGEERLPWYGERQARHHPNRGMQDPVGYSSGPSSGIFSSGLVFTDGV